VERLNLLMAVQNLHTDCDPPVWQDLRWQMWKYGRCREEMKRQHQWSLKVQLPPSPDALGLP
jgi:hypothetical protein